MKLNELQTQYKRVKTISYGTGSKCNEPVYHWKDLQQVGGSLYKDKEFNSKYNGKECCLYLLYPEIDVIDQVQMNTWQTVETFIEQMKSNGFDTAEYFIQSLNNKVKDNQFIGNALIEFSRYFAPENELMYRKARQDYIDKREKKEQEYQKKCKQQRKEEAEKQNQETKMIIENAMMILKNGGNLGNDEITLYDDTYTAHTYNLICYLAEQYSIKIPLKVKG